MANPFDRYRPFLAGGDRPEHDGPGRVLCEHHRLDFLQGGVPHAAQRREWIFDPVTLANGTTPNSIQLGELRLFDNTSTNIFAAAPTFGGGD